MNRYQKAIESDSFYTDDELDYLMLEDENAKLREELKLANEGLTVAYMHGFEKGKDKYKKVLEEIIEYGTTGEDAKLMYMAAKEALDDQG